MKYFVTTVENIKAENVEKIQNVVKAENDSKLYQIVTLAMRNMNLTFLKTLFFQISDVIFIF